METDKNYFLVGLFVIVMISAALGFTFWLNSGGHGGYDHYRIYFSDSVSGLKEESAVRFHGVNVGNVEKIVIDHDNPMLIRVDIRIAHHTPLRADTTASLQLTGISGDVDIELSGGDPKAPELAAQNKDTPVEIPAEKNMISQVASDLPAITHKADTLLEKLNYIADQLEKIFTNQNVKAVNSVVHGLDKKVGDDSQQN